MLTDDADISSDSMDIDEVVLGEEKVDEEDLGAHGMGMVEDPLDPTTAILAPEDLLEEDDDEDLDVLAEEPPLAPF